MALFSDMMDEASVFRTENKRLRAAFIDATRLLTFEQLQQLSKQSALVLKDMNLIIPVVAKRIKV